MHNGPDNSRALVKKGVGIHAPGYDRSKGGHAAATNPENRKMMSEPGKKLGSWAVESGHLARAREHCDYKAMGRLSGRTQGAALLLDYFLAGLRNFTKRHRNAIPHNATRATILNSPPATKQLISRLPLNATFVRETHRTYVYENLATHGNARRDWRSAGIMAINDKRVWKGRLLFLQGLDVLRQVVHSQFGYAVLPVDSIERSEQWAPGGHVDCAMSFAFSIKAEHFTHSKSH